MTVRDIAVAFGFDVDRSSEARTRSSIEGMKNFAAKLLGGIAVVFSVQQLSSFASDCVQAASDVQEMQNKFDVVFQGINEEVDEWATNFADSVGRNKNTIKTYLADQQNLLVGFGMTREEGAKLSEEMTTLALDLASFANLDETMAVNNMTKAVMGETESAKALGAVLNDVTRAETMAAMGLSGKYDKLDQLTKMQVNYNAILRQSPDAVGDCIRSMDSYEAAQRRQKAAVDELKESIGGQLIPIYTVWTNLQTNGIKLATKFAKAILGDTEENNRLLHAFERIHALVKKLQPSFERLSESFKRGINGAGGGMKLILPAFEKFAGFAVDHIARAIDAFVTLADKLGGIQNLFRILTAAAAAFFVITNWGKIVDGVKNVFGALKGLLNLFGGFHLKLLAAVAAVALLFLVIDDFVNFMMGNDSVIGVMFEKAGIDAEAMRQKIINIWENLKTFFGGIWYAILALLEPILTKIKASFKGMFGEDIFVGLGEGIAGVIEFLDRLTGAIAQNEGLQQTIAKMIAGVIKLVAAVKILIPILNTVINVFGVLKGAVTAVWPVIAQLGKFLSSAFGGITMVIGGAVLAVTNFISMFRNGFSAVKEILMVIGVAIAAVGAVILGAPVTVAAAVAGMIAAVATLAVVIKEHWTEIVEWTKNTWDSVIGFLSGVWNKIKTAVADAFTGIKDAVGNALSVVKEKIVSIWTAAYEKVTGVLSAIGGFVSSVWGTVSGTVFSILTGIRNAVETAWNAVTGVVSTAVEMVRNVVTSAWEAVSGAVSSALDTIQNTASSAWNSVTEIVSGAMDVIGGWISSKWDAVVSSTSGALSTVSNVVSSQWSAMTGTVSSAMESISGTVSSVWDSISSAVGAKVSAIRQTVADGFNAAKDIILGLVGEAYQWGADLIGNIVSGIQSGIQRVADAVTGVADKIRSFLHFSVPDEGPLTNFESWMPDMMGQLASGIEQGTGRVTTAVKSLAGAIRSYLHFSVPDAGPLADYEAWMPDFMAGLAKSLEDSGGVLAETVGRIALQTRERFVSAFETLRPVVDDAFQMGADFISGFRDGILSGLGMLSDTLKSISIMTRDAFGTSRGQGQQISGPDGENPKGGEPTDAQGILDKIHELLDNASVFARLTTAQPATAVSSMVSSRTSTVTQNVNIDNTYNGISTDGAKNVTKAMKKSASDATDYMARALAYS